MIIKIYIIKPAQIQYNRILIKIVEIQSRYLIKKVIIRAKIMSLKVKT